MKTYHVVLTFNEPLLGAVPKNKELYADFIAKKAPPGQKTDDEVASVEEMDEKGRTGFHEDEDGAPILYDYVVKGFFKDACGMLRRVTGSRSAALKAHKKVIDGLVFIAPRQIPIDLNGGELFVLERPLRAQTAQGERVALAVSDAAPAGSSIEFDVVLLGGVTKALLKDWLDYGSLRGLGQWRNAGYGRFTYQLTEVKE